MIEIEDPTAALTAAKEAVQKAREAALARLNALDTEKAAFLGGQLAERKHLKEALRVRAFLPKPRAVKPEEKKAKGGA
jgi:hypothetical protein